MEDIIRTCNPTVKFSKFTSIKNIELEFEEFFSKSIWRETFQFPPITFY